MPKEKIYDYNFWLKNCVHPDDVLRLKEYRNKKKYPKTIQYRIINPDNKIRWIELSNISQKKKGEYFICIEKDITEKKEGRELQELLEVNVNNMSDGIAILHLEKGQYLYVNHKMTKIFELTKEQFYTDKNYTHWLTRIHPKDKKKQTHYIKEKCFPEKREYRIIRSDNRVC
jgi:PAS domain-containing protein